jgi:hypothetical protein
MRALQALAVTAVLSPLSGCCSLARLFCGPDSSAWIQIDYSTPERTVHVLLEAVRRDNPQVVYESLAEEYRADLKLDRTSAQVAWQQLKDQTPGLHLLGYATVPPPTRLADDGATFVLDVEGRTLRIDLVRESFWEIAYRRPPEPKSDGSAPAPTAQGTLGEQRRRVTSWNTLARIEPLDDPDRDLSRIVLEPVQFEHEGQVAVPLESIERVGLVRRWKIANLAMQQ